MSELFDEVDEDVRREQLKKLWEKYSLYIVGLALLIIAGVGGWRAYQHFEAKKAAEAGAAFNAAIDLADQNKHEEAEAAFARLAASAPAGYRELARLRAAAELAARDPKAAVKAYDDIAADRSVSAIDRDLARLRAGSLLVDAGSYADVAHRLEAAAEPGAPYRHSARELLALSAWKAGDAATARKWLDAIVADAETPGSLRARADTLQALLPPAAKS